MLCFLPTQNVVQEGGGPQQATGVGAYGSAIKVIQDMFPGGPTRAASKAFLDRRTLCRTCSARDRSTRASGIVSLSRREPHPAHVLPIMCEPRV